MPPRVTITKASDFPADGQAKLEQLRDNRVGYDSRDAQEDVAYQEAFRTLARTSGSGSSPVQLECCDNAFSYFCK